MLDTVRDAPSETIVPTIPTSGTIAQRAMALLAQLSGSSPAASVHLRQGEVIGEGGMGIVRAAEQVTLGRTVAVKTLKPGRRDQRAALDLLREAWVTGSIEHPNVVPVHYIGIDDEGFPLIVLKRIEGVEWSQLMGDAAEVERRFGARDLVAWNLGILMQVLNAVRFAHHRGVVHRDLKPSNVMIGDFGEVYLLDWGIAVSLRDDGSGRLPLASAATDMAGTPCYMAPEMLGRDGGPPLSERTDVYLAGAILFELITGEPPHGGTTALAVISSVIASDPVLPANVPGELARIVKRAMHVEPGERYQSAEEMRLVLQRYLEHRGSAELAARAQLGLDELLGKLAAGTPDPEEVHRLFGACRFGFHEALSAWRENGEARAGLERGTIAVAEYELAADNPAAAVTLLGELEPAPELLAKARVLLAAQIQRRDELEKLSARHDASAGKRTRSMLTGLLGLSFTVIPLAAQMWPQIGFGSNERMFVWSAGSLVVVLLAVWWARDTMLSTAFNRRVAATGVFLFVNQCILILGCSALGLAPLQTQILMLITWGILTGMLAIAVEPWLAPSSAFYFVCFALAVRFPDAHLYITALANFAFAINAVWRWRPASFKITPEERERLDRQIRSRRSRR